MERSLGCRANISRRMNLLPKKFSYRSHLYKCFALVLASSALLAIPFLESAEAAVSAKKATKKATAKSTAKKTAKAVVPHKVARGPWAAPNYADSVAGDSVQG